MSKIDEWMAEESKNRLRQILRDGESHREWRLLCPYCGGENLDDLYLEPDGDWDERDCEKCDRTFLCKSELTYSSKVVTK